MYIYNIHIIIYIIAMYIYMAMGKCTEEINSYPGMAVRVAAY